MIEKINLALCDESGAKVRINNTQTETRSFKNDEIGKIRPHRNLYEISK